MYIVTEHYLGDGHLLSVKGIAEDEATALDLVNELGRKADATAGMLRTIRQTYFRLEGPYALHKAVRDPRRDPRPNDMLRVEERYERHVVEYEPYEGDNAFVKYMMVKMTATPIYVPAPIRICTLGAWRSWVSQTNPVVVQRGQD